jgi:hypothetical protein
VCKTLRLFENFGEAGAASRMLFGFLGLLLWPVGCKDSEWATLLFTASAGTYLMQDFDFGSVVRITVWSVFLLVAFFTGCR